MYHSFPSHSFHPLPSTIFSLFVSWVSFSVLLFHIVMYYDIRFNIYNAPKDVFLK